jgi:iron complex transport system permease protein
MMRTQYWWGLAGLALLAAATFCAALLIGSAGLSSAGAVRALFGGGDDFSRMIVQTVRLPRAIAGLRSGACWPGGGAAAGAVSQSTGRSAGPGGLGRRRDRRPDRHADRGRLCGHALLCDRRRHADRTAVLLLARGGGATRLLLCGVVLASACGAVLTVLLTLADNGQLRGMVFWLAGDLSWTQRPTLLLLLGRRLLAAFLGGRWLNVLGAGELRSATVGIPAGGARLVVFAASAALTSIAVIGGGMIGFVGLIAPHLVRLGSIPAITAWSPRPRRWPAARCCAWPT